MPNLNPTGTPEAVAVKLGDATGSTKISAAGLEMTGVATMWDDLTSSLIARRLNATTGKLQYNYTENSITMQPGGLLSNTADTLSFSYQKKHACKVDSGMRLHIHWEQNSTDIITFSGQYRIQSNGAAKTTVWTPFTSSSDTDSAFTYVSGVLNQITNLVAVDLSLVALSSTVQFQLVRSDVTASDIDATFVDAHIELDSIGSNQEYIK